MSSPLRSILSASIGPGLTLFTVASAWLNGPLAVTTTVAFVLAVVWGVIELALVSYTPIASIELDRQPPLEDDREASGPTEAGGVVAFSDPDPWRQRAA